MGLTVKALHVGDIMMDWSFVLFQYKPGRKTCIPINAFLIQGAETPILIDTGILAPSIFQGRFGEIGFLEPEQDLMRQLKEHGLKPEDIGCIIHTHLDVDHTGNNHRLPKAKVIVQRQEMAYQASCGRRRAPDLPWFISNLDRIQFINGDIELYPGVKCVFAPAHTPGHQHVEVQTDRGKVIMTGDTVYDIPMQLEDKVGPGIMWPSGHVNNQAQLQDELFRLKCELKNGAVLCPSHGYEPFDRFRLGEKRSDKRRDYEGFSDYNWPPV
jgi:glyoxylase-like metal-dependent hydrolase (beta-lactamase superfamily II)